MSQAAGRSAQKCPDTSEVALSATDGEFPASQPGVLAGRSFRAPAVPVPIGLSGVSGPGRPAGGPGPLAESRDRRPTTIIESTVKWHYQIPVRGSL
eukprot:74594-Hanusia_phi.AAC.2